MLWYDGKIVGFESHAGSTPMPLRRDALATLHATLRERTLASPLCDAARFARNLEDALHGMWARYAAGDAPARDAR